MKHVVNFVGIVGRLVVGLVLMVLGFLVLPIAVNFRKSTINLEPESNQECFSWSWVDKIWGNKYDGFADKYYRRDFPIDTYWSRINWCMLRNPIHNFGLSIGVDAVITKSITTGNQDVTDDPFDKNMGLKIQECWDENGKYYPMYYYCFLWRNVIPLYKGDKGFRFLAGYKNFVVSEVNKHYHYSSVCVVTPFKTFVEG